jgi:hypothetical protein
MSAATIEVIKASTTPDGVSILISRPGCAYVVGEQRSGFKPGAVVSARTSGGRDVALTVHSAKKAREWWATSESGAWYVLRSERPTSVAQMRTMNGPQRIYRRDKRGRFCR